MSLQSVIAGKPTEELERIKAIESAQRDVVLIKAIDAELTKRNLSEDE